MFSIKGFLCAALCAVPPVLSVVAVIYGLWLLIPIQLILLFVIIAAVPYFRKRETIWMFIGVAVSMLPVNIYGAVFLSEYLSTGEITAVIWCFILFYVFFSIEELFFGFLSRIIWRRQYKIKI